MKEEAFIVHRTIKHADSEYLVSGRAGIELSIGNQLYFEKISHEKIIFIIKGILEHRKRVDVLGTLHSGDLILERINGPHVDFNDLDLLCLV